MNGYDPLSCGSREELGKDENEDERWSRRALPKRRNADARSRLSFPNWTKPCSQAPTRTAVDRAPKPVSASSILILCDQALSHNFTRGEYARTQSSHVPPDTPHYPSTNATVLRVDVEIYTTSVLYVYCIIHCSASVPLSFHQCGPARNCPMWRRIDVNRDV